MDWIYMKRHGEYNPPKVCRDYLFAFAGPIGIVYKVGGLRTDGRLYLKENPEKLVYKKNLIAYAPIDTPDLPKNLKYKYSKFKR
jgi:hypothetical protein|nr:MAG TPA: hypothetical protein [Caudoviricetes sp.]